MIPINTKSFCNQTINFLQLLAQIDLQCLASEKSPIRFLITTLLFKISNFVNCSYSKANDTVLYIFFLIFMALAILCYYNIVLLYFLSFSTWHFFFKQNLIALNACALVCLVTQTRQQSSLDELFNDEEKQINEEEISNLSFIARGATGTIMKGKYNDREVVVKRVGAKERESIRRELSVMLSLRHANLLSPIGHNFSSTTNHNNHNNHNNHYHYYNCNKKNNDNVDNDLNHYQDYSFFVTDYYQHGDLFHFIRNHPDAMKSKELVLKIALAITKGVNHLHKNNYVHRDLKSENILVNSMDPNDEEIVKVMDFGDTVSVQDCILNHSYFGNSSCSFTRKFRNTFMHDDKDENDHKWQAGTARWAAPETTTNGSYSFSSDVFSLAIIFWELIACELPFSDVKFNFQVSDKICNGDRPQLPTIVADDNSNTIVPIAFLELIQHCWAEKASDRPSTDAIIATLEDLIVNSN